MDTDFEPKLEKYFEEWFAYELRDLRGTEIEIMNTKASAHKWFFVGAAEMRRVFARMMLDQNQRWANELDPNKIR